MSWIVKVLSLSISCLVLADGLPTSVLVDSKVSALKSGDAALGGEKFLATAADGPSSATTKSNPKKRGAVLPELPQLEFLPKGDLYLLNQNSPEGGVWGEEGAVVGGGGYFERGDPAATRGFYDNGFYGYSPYENIQDLINSREEEFSEPVAMPLVYPVAQSGDDTGFYGIRRNNGYRRKRSNKKTKAYRLKRESDRINAAEALALLELIEAQESVRHRPDDYWYNRYATNDESNDDGLWLDSWTEPTARYYAVPQPTINYSPYEPTSYAPSKRFMVAKKKKRSLADTRDWRMGMKARMLLAKPHGSLSKFEQNGRHSFPELAGFKPNQKSSQ